MFQNREDLEKPPESLTKNRNVVKAESILGCSKNKKENSEYKFVSEVY
jgi:hypothetical protein